MAEESFIRGAAATGVDPRRVGWFLALLLVISLAGASIAFAVASASNDSSTSRLRHHGVLVQATVTSCAGISSGVGMGIEYYECSGQYTLAGHTFDEPILGSRSQRPPGQVVEALAIPGDPASLALPSSIHSSSAGSWAAAAVLGGCAIAGAAALVLIRRRGRGIRGGLESGRVPK